MPETFRVEYRKPKDGTWTLIGWEPNAEGFKYENSMGATAVSSVHEIEGKPQWHVSFSHRGERIPQGWMEALLRQWGLEGWDEDNHVPNGRVRNYWRPVSTADPLVCPCKANEEPFEEHGGYIWRLDSKAVGGAT